MNSLRQSYRLPRASVCLFLGLVTAQLLVATPSLGAVSSMEIASMARPHSADVQKWLKLLNELGIASVRLRTYQQNDQPSIEDFGTEARPVVRLVALLNRRGELVLPGGRFTLRDRTKLSNYLERAGKEGAASVTASRGMFGLTELEFRKLFERLSQPLPAELVLSNNSPPKLADLVERLDDPIRVPIKVDRQVAGAMQVVPEGYDEVKSLAQGTALAILLRGEGLAMHPMSKPGAGVVLTIKNQTKTDLSKSKDSWPIGYESEASPNETFPKLFERIDVEIEGYSLAEAVGAVGAQLGGLPIVWDHFALRSNGIVPSTVQVKLAKTRTYYKRILDKLLFQARLKGELRIDETGKPFYWVTK